MAIGKVQTLIVERLIEMGRLTNDQHGEISAKPEELTGGALDKLL